MAEGEFTEISWQDVQPEDAQPQQAVVPRVGLKEVLRNLLKFLKFYSLQALRFINRSIKVIALKLIWIYQHYISPYKPPSCRFHPTCSHYTYQAIERFGLWRGGWLGFCRLCRCHPFHSGGLDLVPETYPTLRPSMKWLSARWRKDKTHNVQDAIQDYKTTKHNI